MILKIEINDTIHNVDVGDISSMTPDEKTEALHTAMTDAGLDADGDYMILGEAE